MRMDSISAKIAETWFKFTPSCRIEDILASVTIPADPSLDDLMDIAIRLEDCFVSLYRHAASQAVSAEIRDVFEHLELETVKDRTKLARDLVDMHDLM